MPDDSKKKPEGQAPFGDVEQPEETPFGRHVEVHIETLGEDDMAVSLGDAAEWQLTLDMGDFAIASEVDESPHAAVEPTPQPGATSEAEVSPFDSTAPAAVPLVVQPRQNVEPSALAPAPNIFDRQPTVIKDADSALLEALAEAAAAVDPEPARTPVPRRQPVKRPQGEPITPAVVLGGEGDYDGPTLMMSVDPARLERRDTVLDIPGDTTPVEMPLDPTGPVQSPARHAAPPVASGVPKEDDEEWDIDVAVSEELDAIAGASGGAPTVRLGYDPSTLSGAYRASTALPPTPTAAPEPDDGPPTVMLSYDPAILSDRRPVPPPEDAINQSAALLAAEAASADVSALSDPGAMPLEHIPAPFTPEPKPRDNRIIMALVAVLLLGGLVGVLMFVGGGEGDGGDGGDEVNFDDPQDPSGTQGADPMLGEGSGQAASVAEGTGEQVAMAEGTGQAATDPEQGGDDADQQVGSTNPDREPGERQARQPDEPDETDVPDPDEPHTIAAPDPDQVASADSRQIRLTINSDPPAARVYLDDNRIGRTPFSETITVSGDAGWLTIRKSDFRAYRHRVAWAEDQVEIVVTLEPSGQRPDPGDPEPDEPRVDEPETTEPETTEPEVAEPETTEPEVAEPEVAEPETTEPETTEPDEPEPSEPDEVAVTEPEEVEEGGMVELVLTSVPTGVSVEMGGRVIGHTPLTTTVGSAGRYVEVRINHPGYAPRRFFVTTSESRVERHIELTPIE